MKISENTSVSMPMKNLISIVISVAIGVWAYFGIVEKLNKHSTTLELMQADLLKKAQQEPLLTLPIPFKGGIQEDCFILSTV